MQSAETLIDRRLRAVADPTRRDILRLIRSGEQPAGHLARHFAMSRPAVSRHLRVLREARLVRVREDGTQRLYQADEQALTDLARWFDRFWDEGLPRLKALAEKEARE